MTDPFHVPAREHGVVRVFTTDLEPEGNAAITPENVGRLLGADIEPDPKHVEVFPSKMIETMGLSTYLAEGYGIPEEDLAGTAAALDTLNGLIVLVASPAFRGSETVLDPGHGLRFVGACAEPAPAPPQHMAAPETAEGSLPPQDGPPPPSAGRKPGTGLVLAALLLAAALVLFLAF